jgi:hypothetical protein
MVYLDWRYIGEPFHPTFVLVRVHEGKVHAELNQWTGIRNPYRAHA